MTVVTAETRWLLACVRSLEGQTAGPPPTRLNWDRALALAEAEGLAPALGFVVKAAAPATMPPTVGERLRRHLADSTATHLIFTRELVRLMEVFEQEDVPVIPLKGPALAELLYPVPGLRPCTDLDLLIRRQTLGVVDALLQRLGYRHLADDHSWSFDVTYDRATVYEGPRGIHVDLHWSLVSDPRFAWNEGDGLGVFERGVKQPLGGGQSLALCPEDLLLYLAVHLAVHHGLAGLLWYWDLARFLDRFGDRLEWETVLARAGHWRVRTALYFALVGCRRLLDVSAPPAVLSRLRMRGPRAAALRWLTDHRETDRLRHLEHLIALLLVDRARDLIGPLKAALFPSRAWLRARYGASGSLLAYLAHWRRMAVVARGAAQALARGRPVAPGRH